MADEENQPSTQDVTNEDQPTEQTTAEAAEPATTEGDTEEQSPAQEAPAEQTEAAQVEGDGGKEGGETQKEGQNEGEAGQEPTEEGEGGGGATEATAGEAQEATGDGDAAEESQVVAEAGEQEGGGEGVEGEGEMVEGDQVEVAQPDAQETEAGQEIVDGGEEEQENAPEDTTEPVAAEDDDAAPPQETEEAGGEQQQQQQQEQEEVGAEHAGAEEPIMEGRNTPPSPEVSGGEGFPPQPQTFPDGVPAPPSAGPPLPSQGEGPRSGSRMSEEPNDVSLNALNMTWSFGINKYVPAINLTDRHRRMVLYACGNTAVLCSYDNNTQRLLQGHCNNITCICASQDKRWVATADKGENSMVIIWDTYSGTPVQTIFDPHPEGVIGINMTLDAKYIVTLSASKKQTLCIWDWTTNGDSPVCSTELGAGYGQQTYVLFNPEDPSQIVSNSSSQVIFYKWKGEEMEFFAPPLTDQDFNRVVGNFSQSIFIPNSTRALTATGAGNVVVWHNQRPATGPANLDPSPNKKAFKLVRLQERGITVLTSTEGFVVTGDVLGHVKFYDLQLRMSNWYSDFNVGPLNSVSFSHVPEFQPEANQDSDYPQDATIYAKSFVTRDYIISTSSAQVALIITDGTQVKMILEEHDKPVHALTSHPSQPYLVIGSYAGLLKVWNYETKEVIVSRKFPKGNLIRCVGYNPTGAYLGVGFENGCVRVLDALTLIDENPEPFRYSRDAVTYITFSHDSQWMATADADYCVTVYKADTSSNQEPWIYMGKHRAHYKHIRGVTFGTALDSGAPRLLSLGEDRSMVEYDLKTVAKDSLKVLSTDRIEQSAVPQCFAWYPPITKEQFFLITNNQFKFKLYNTTTKMCRRTVLAPTYGSPIQRIAVLPSEDPVNDTRFMAYVTKDKVGLHKMPPDGNPHNAMALIAHPSGVTNLVCSYDGKHVFTAGGTDYAVHMWDTNFMALEAAVKLGGDDLIPFYGLMEGGREGELFKELENYFYYAQIRSQGVDTMDMRQVSTQIPLSEIPFVMRAMGHYPSEQEVEDMINEVKFSKYVDSGEYVSQIDLGTFIKLYVNHRPAFGISERQLDWAFDVLGYAEDEALAPELERGELLELLQTKGEHMTEAEVAEYLTTLLGINPEGGSSELGGYDPAGAQDILEEVMPEDITAEMFATELLGFGAGREQSEAGTVSVME